MLRLCRALVAAAIVVAVGFAVMPVPSAEAGASPHWRRAPNRQVLLLLDRDASMGDSWWSVAKNRAKRIEGQSTTFEFAAVASCRLEFQSFCVRVRTSDHANGLAGNTSVRYDPVTGHISYAIVTINRYYLRGETRKYLYSVVCHELGHLIGAVHRGSGRTCMRDDNVAEYTELDGHDIAFSNVLHHPH